jgi:hypothetical protein
MSLLPVGVLERVARSDASLVRRQAVRHPVAALLASAQGVGVAVVGGWEVEDVVLVGDVVVLVGDWSRDGEGESAGQEGEEGEGESGTHVGLRFVGRLLGW